MNDTTRRFLTAIVDRVPAGGRIVELRLFPAIRQGGVESGVAVVAVEPAEVEVAPEEFAVAAHDIVDIDVAVEDEEGMTSDEIAAVTSFIPLADTASEEEVGEALDDEMNTIVVSVSREVIAAEGAATISGSHVAVSEGGDAEGDGERNAEVAVHVEPSAAPDDSPYADVAIAEVSAHRPILADARDNEADAAVEGEEGAPSASRLSSPASRPHLADTSAPGERDETVALVDILALPSPEGADAVPVEAETPAEPARPRRYAILTARYRLTFKGPDRGKWDVEITHEADAPLDTVGRVARGVAKRAGEESEPEQFSGESLRLALEAPVWATTP